MKEEQDIRVFYLVNGQIIFAEFIEENDDSDMIIKRPVSVMLGQNKQIGMSTAFPFSHIDATFALNWRQLITSSSLDWNPSLIREFGNFWTQMTEKAKQQASGIEVVPANAVPPGLEKAGLMGPRPNNMPPLRSV
jgi:ubiquinone biosynthesis protein UbiJ